MTIQFKKAERSQVKLKVGITGPSGSGKTLGALSLAMQISPAGKIAVIDTENGSAALYSDRFDFDTLELAPPYLSSKFEQAIDAAAEAGYDVAIIDSASHQWAGEGGILGRKEQADARGGNQWTNWAPFTKEHESFKAAILNAPIHIIGTLRTKQEYVLEDKKGKQVPRKVGMAPIQREGMEYEFSVVFDVQMDHRAKVSKDRTGLFGDDRIIDLIDGSVGKELLAWLSTAKPVVVQKPTEEQVERLLDLAAQVGEKASEEVGRKLRSGMTPELAGQWITKLEQRLNAQGATA